MSLADLRLDMWTIKKILVPIDFSETALVAMRRACDLASKYDAEITLFHAYWVSGFALPEGFLIASPEQVAEAIERLQRELEKNAESVKALGVDKVRTESVEGVPFAEIVRQAREGKHDLIVMGTHGRTGLSHALLGSVTEKVVRKAPCPVLTIRSPEHKFTQP